jgi:PAS domain S-box-containing protein
MSTHRTVLVIADSDQGDHNYKHQLPQDEGFAYWVLSAQDCTEILALVQSQQIDSILLSVHSPDAAPFDALKQLKEMGDRCPPIVVIGGEDAETAVQAFKHGATDYLIQGRMTPEDLRLTLFRAIENLERRLSRATPSLQSSLQRDQDLAEAMPSIVWTADATGAVNYWNQRWYEYTGLSQTESLGVAGVSTVHPEERDRTLEQWNQSIVLGQPFEIEYRIRRWDGVYYWFICRAVPTRDQQNQLRGWIGTMTNIDEIKHSEALLRQSEQQLQQQLAEIEAIYQSAPIGLNVLDTDLRFVRINQQLAEMNGFPIEAHIGRTIRELLPDLADVADQHLRPILETGEPLLNVEVEGETPAQPGVKRTWLEHFIPLKQGDQVIGISTVCQEITEQRRMEAALRQSEERFRQMADHAPVMIWVTDPAGYCTYLSKSWYEFTGQTEATGLGFGWLETVHPEDYERSRESFLRANEQHEAFRLEYRLRHKNGEYRWAIDAASPWFGEGGMFKGYIGSVVDIHDRKQAEEALRRSENRYRTLFESMNEGFCVIEMLFDAHNRPCDYRFLEMNPAFEQQTGLQQAEGQTVRQLLPNLEQDWFEIYGNVALSGEPVRFEHRSEALNRWFEVSAFRLGSPDSRKVAILFRDISQRKQAEQERQESQTRFRTLADNISQFAWMADATGHIFWYNQRWFDYPGTTLEQVQGWSWQQIHHPDHLERVRTKFEQCIETGEIWEDTFPLRGRDGQYRWFLSRAVPIRDEQGKVLRWFGTNTDVTELRQTEMALQQTTERLNIALKSAPLSLFNQDLNLRYTWIYNPTHNLSVEEIIGQRDEDLASPETAARLTQLKQQVLDTGVGLREEVEVVQQGQVTYYDLTVDPLRNSQNAIVGVTCAAVDISEKAKLEADRKQAEEALRQSEDRLRMAIESAQLGTWDWNLTMNQLTWDDGCKSMFGIPSQVEISIEEFFRRLHPEDRDRLEQVVQWSCDPVSGGQYEVEYRIIHAQNGNERWIAAKGQVYFDACKNPQRFIGTVLDITEQKQVEAERELLFQREQAAREEAERANRIKDEFLAILSHELRSPLNPILGWTKLLQSRQFDAATTAQALATIERNAKLQTQLIDDLLDIARILRGKLSLNITSVNLAAVIEAAIDTVRTTAEVKSIALHLELPNVGQVSGDTARLQQIVWNLLSNAIKFTPEGGRVEVKAEQVEHQVQIIVSDTGKGISAAFLPYIFESFRQEDVSTTRKHGGLGLGLAIVRQLVEAHGGTVRAESPGEGRGARFTVQLPLLTTDAPIQPISQPPPSDLSLAGVRVLAVDDEPDARELLTILLTEYGANVLAVSSAVEVFSVLESFQPHVLVSDIGMPSVDGYALIQQVRTLPPDKGGQTPAIALTAYVRESDHQRALTSGYQQHVTKPLEPDRLVQAVSRLAQGTFNAPTTPTSSSDLDSP